MIHDLLTGRKKVEKYSSQCNQAAGNGKLSAKMLQVVFSLALLSAVLTGNVSYVDLGPLPVSDDREEQIVLEGMSTNSTRKQAHITDQES